MPISTIQSGSFPSNVAIDTDTLVVDGANNRVGVGTASPATALDVTGSVTSDGLTVDGATTVNNADLLLNGGSPEIIFQTGASHYNWMIAAQENVSNALEISSGSQDGDYSNDTWTPRLVINSSGIVGIGTSAPSGAKLEIFTASTSVDGLKISRYTPGNYYSTLRQDNHGLAVHVGTGGTVSERVAITPNGITFNGDTAAANALDDYEEGTITDLRIYFDTNLSATSSTGSSYVTATGAIYTKIGRLVTVQFYWSGTYNANQVLLKHMENLPFVVGSSNNGFYGGNTSIPYHRGFSGYYRYNTSTDLSNNINLLASPGTNAATFKSWAHSFTSTGFPLMNAGSGQELSASLTYMT